MIILTASKNYIICKGLLLHATVQVKYSNQTCWVATLTCNKNQHWKFANSTRIQHKVLRLEPCYACDFVIYTDIDDSSDFKNTFYDALIYMQHPSWLVQVELN